MSHFSLPFKIVFHFWRFNSEICWCGSLWTYPVWSFPSFFTVQMNVFHKFGVFSHAFLNILSAPLSFFYSPSGTLSMYMLIHWLCPTGLWGSVHFSFCSPHWINQLTYLQICWLFLLPAQIYWWVPIVYFFIVGIVLSALEFLSGFFSHFYLYLLFSISRDTVARLSFNSSYLVSYSPLHMFLRDQDHWTMSKTFGAPPGQFLFTFYLVNGPYIHVSLHVL